MRLRKWVAAVECRWPEEEDGAGVFAGVFAALCMICILRNGL